jgi:hypothetical protein
MEESDREQENALYERLLASIERAMAASSEPFGSARSLSADCVIAVGRTPVLVKIREGQITACERALPLLCSREFTIRGSVVAWKELWQAFPAPGWHDLFALTKRGEMSVEGNTQKFMAHLQFFKDLIALPRSAA